jgi:hypothetical protein
MNALIVDAEVGEGAFVAACALLRAGRKVLPRQLAAGVPAKVPREPRTERAWEIEGTRAWQALTLPSRHVAGGGGARCGRAGPGTAWRRATSGRWWRPDSPDAPLAQVDFFQENGKAICLRKPSGT